MVTLNVGGSIPPPACYKWFQEEVESAPFNTYYYSVGLVFIVIAAPVPSRTSTVPHYLVSKA